MMRDGFMEGTDWCTILHRSRCQCM